MREQLSSELVMGWLGTGERRTLAPRSILAEVTVLYIGPLLTRDNSLVALDSDLVDIGMALAFALSMPRRVWRELREFRLRPSGKPSLADQVHHGQDVILRITEIIEAVGCRWQRLPN